MPERLATCNLCREFTVPWGDHIGAELMHAHQATDCPGPPPPEPTYFEPPNYWNGTAPSVFLAGGISSCPNWQDTARRILQPHAVILNPRRPFTWNPPSADEQMRWEYDHLRRASVVLFWFPKPDAEHVVQPIAFFELGYHLAARTLLTVGADPGFTRHHDVVVQTRMARPSLTVHNRLEDVCAAALQLIRGPGVSDG